MHRLSPKPPALATDLLRVHAAIPLLLLALLLPACGGAPSERAERDPPHVERLRMRISEVRHATADVRRTIAASQGAPHLPELYLRLGELTSEEARYHYRVAFEREQRSSKNLTVPIFSWAGIEPTWKPQTVGGGAKIIGEE